MKSSVTPHSSGSQTVMSMDAVFVMHYMSALDALQKTWLDSDKEIDEVHFGMQIEYLIRLIPDEETQNKIQQDRVKLQQDFKAKRLDHPNERAGLCVVTHLITFICNSFDLLHIDIVGPATSRQYRDAAVEIPDMPGNLLPADTVEPIPANGE